jgi:hypothetical protein
MAHMGCKCGNRLSNVGFPNEMEGEIKGIYEYQARDVWECAECGRLWIDIDDPEVKGCHISKSYLPEDGNPGELFEVGNGEQLIKYLKEMWMFHKEEFLKIEIGEL